MAQYEEDGVQFNLLALCKSPLLSIPPRMAEQIKSLKRVESMLDYVKMDWKELTTFDATLGQPDEMYGLTRDIMDKVRLSKPAIEVIENAEGSLEDLMRLHQQLWLELGQLRGSYMEELSAINQENEQAATKMVDHTAALGEQITAHTTPAPNVDVQTTKEDTTEHTDPNSTDRTRDAQEDGESAKLTDKGNTKGDENMTAIDGSTSETPKTPLEGSTMKAEEDADNEVNGEMNAPAVLAQDMPLEGINDALPDHTIPLKNQEDVQNTVDGHRHAPGARQSIRDAQGNGPQASPSSPGVLKDIANVQEDGSTGWPLH
jgi:hypothetical protein